MNVSMEPGPLPPPLVEFRRDPKRWLYNRAVLAAEGVLLAHVGVLVVAGLYYLITQTNPTVKQWWDTTVTPASLRHDIRDVGEGVLASCLAQAIVWDPFKRSHYNTGRVLRRVRERFGVPVGVAAVGSAVAIGAVAFVVGEIVLHRLPVHSAQHHASGSLWNRTTTLWKSNWDKKALGFLAAIAARRPLHFLFDETQAYFAGRRATTRIGVRWYHPPVFKARYSYLTDHPVAVRQYPALLTYISGAALVASIAVAGFGYYVLTYKA